MKTLPQYLITVLSVAFLSNCGAPSYDAPTSFESASLNTSYRGPYQRPVAQAGRVPPDSIPSLTAGSEQPGDSGSSQDSTRRSDQSQEERGSRADAEHALLIDGQADESAQQDEHQASPPTSLPGITADSRSEDDSSHAEAPLEPTGNPSLDYVRSVYALNGIEFESPDELQVVDLYRAVQKQGTIYHSARPVVGDLVFFHNTEDRNTDGRNNDWYTHVGIVESVEDDGTVTFLHYSQGSVRTGHLNLEDQTPADGASAATNSQIRPRKAADPEYTQYLAGDLFAGFGSVLGDRSQFYVVDEWHPGDMRDGHASLAE
jgi:hypothetical protein